jgi:hypothetical protein
MLDSIVDFCVEHADKIFTGIGVVSSVGAVVAAGFGVKKYIEDDKIKEAKEHLKKLHEQKNDILSPEEDKDSENTEETEENEETEKEEKPVKLTKKEYNKAVLTEYKTIVLRTTMHFALAASLEVLSVASFLEAINILDVRYQETASALAAVTASTEAYRRRVAEELGEEKEAKLWAGASESEVSKNVDISTGETSTVVARDIKVSDLKNLPYNAVIYKRGMDSWTDDLNNNKFRVNVVETELNMELERCGEVTLHRAMKRFDGKIITPPGALTLGVKHDPEKCHQIVLRALPILPDPGTPAEHLGDWQDCLVVIFEGFTDDLSRKLLPCKKKSA